MESFSGDTQPTKLGLRSLLGAAARPRFGGLWSHHDFMRLWAGQTISQLGSTITREALPYTAILVLGATPVQMGLLGAAGAAPLLLLGLFAGVWVDRVRRRPLMIASDIGRALLLLSVPIAYVLGWLRIEQLYLVAALVGVLTVFFNVAYQASLPGLIRREHLLEGNSKLGLSDSLAEIAGPPLGGVLVQLASGPIALLLDALSFVFSVFMLGRIRAQEPPPAPLEQHEHVVHDLATGLRAIWDDPLLRAMAGTSAIQNFFGWFFGAIYGLYAIHVVGMGTATLGITVAFGGLGALVGALLVRPATRRFGLGPTIVGGLLISSITSLLIWLAGGSLAIAVPLMMASQLIGDGASTIAAIDETSLRQTITPDSRLGRVNGSMNVLGEGIGTLGLLFGGVLAEQIGLRSTVAVAALGSLLGCVWILCSPLPRLRDLPLVEDTNRQEREERQG
ncbi:MAG TPA: MFS transporter [Roseiflexaceae bacterium]|nr:MFS transporter [Roseiflexaceae bacterium]